MTEGYRALREATALLDLSGRGILKAAGEDRVRLIHAMSTNHIEQLEAGQGCYLFFLTAQGRILADAQIYALPDHLLLDTEPETGEKLYEHIDRYIIADDVEIENLTGGMGVLALEGPDAEKLLDDAGSPVPDENRIVEWDTVQVARTSITGGPGFRIYVPASEKEALAAKFAGLGAVRAEAADVRIVRLENGRPRYGEDLTEGYIPQETQLLHALHFTKGCYLGQEIVERVRSRGQVNKKLVPLRLSAEVESETKLTAEGKPAGVVTSSVTSPALGHVVGLGYVRTAFVKEGQKLEAGDVEAEVTGLAPR